MHERESSAGQSVESSKNTVWYGVGKAVEKGATALGPDAWRKRILHIIDTQIIPRSTPKWQEWAKNHREEIEHVATVSGVNITVVEIALGSVAVLWGAKKLQKVFKKPHIHSGSLSENSIQIHVKDLPPQLRYFWAQIHNLGTDLGTTVTRKLESVMLLMADTNVSKNNEQIWLNIVRLANAGKVAAAFGLFEQLFLKEFHQAGILFGWGKDVPSQVETQYAKSLSRLWLTEFAHVGSYASTNGTNSDMDRQKAFEAIVKIGDYASDPKDQQAMYRLIELFTKENSSDADVLKQSLKDIRRMFRYMRTRQNREGRRIIHYNSIMDQLPFSEAMQVSLDHVGSFSVANEEEIAESMKSTKKPLTSLKGYIVKHDFAKERMLGDELLKEPKLKPKSWLVRLKRSIQGITDQRTPRQFPIHSNVPTIGSYGYESTLDLNNISFGKPNDNESIIDTSDGSLGNKVQIFPANTVTINGEEVIKPIELPIAKEPKNLAERIYLEILQLDHKMRTQSRVRRLKQARKEYAAAHPKTSFKKKRLT